MRDQLITEMVRGNRPSQYLNGLMDYVNKGQKKTARVRKHWAAS